MSCDCAHLPDAISVEGASALVIANLDLVEESVQSWAKLYRCRSCGQHWKLDVVAAQDRIAPVAVKLPNAEQWIAFDDSLARRDLVIRAHGGLSEARCVWAGCEERALKGQAVCVNHADPNRRGSRRSG